MKPLSFILLAMISLPTFGVTIQDVRINEIRIDQPSTDTDEYFELVGPPGLSLNGLTYLVIGDGVGGSGEIEEMTDLTGSTIPESGYFLAAEATLTGATPNLTTDLNFENNDNVTHLLVTGFNGSNGQDLDTNDDGVLDLTPWTEVVDLIALIREENPPTQTEYHYGPPTVGPDTGGLIGYVRRCSGEWTVGSFDPVGGQDTPGAVNNCTIFTAGNCGDLATLIHDIQGNGSTSLMEGTTGVVIEGIVVGDYQDNTTRLGGFFIQEEDEDADADPMTSEGIFVFDGSFGVDVSVGDKVRVQGDVTEFQGLTELNNVTLVSICGSDQSLPASVQIDLPLADLSEWESYEGMLVEIAGPLAVSDSYFLGRFGQVTLSKMGRLFRPTGVVTPGAESLELQDLNNRRRILIDDGSRIQYPDPPVPPLD
ncbi:MAG: hypothetical protein KC964_30810, partial [Candidatus Omnitrophica bacterium]|nr:hypothetical protein [Candidatus Omnitrophota bacterium]